MNVAILSSYIHSLYGVLGIVCKVVLYYMAKYIVDQQKTYEIHFVIATG